MFQDDGDTGNDVAAGTSNEIEKHQGLDAALDKLRARHGRKVIYFGSVQESRDQALDAYRLHPHPGRGD